ncbi:MAG: hypothetical protein L3J00_04775 [Thiomicrorhabdus sp.]|nr:hypothetical protein [Thiomicrorhabdus sp.]
MRFKKIMLKISLYIGIILLLLFFFMPGCDVKMPHEEGYVPMTKIVELKEVGRCKNEPGTLMRVNYVGLNTLMFFSKFSYFVSPNMGKFCIPDLDEGKRKMLSKAEQQKLEVGFFNARDFSLGSEMVKDADGNVSHQSIALRRLQELVRMGSELAYLELHLFDYKDTKKSFKFSEDNPYYQRLKQLAKSGNAEAMCLFSMRKPTPFVGYEHLKYGSADGLETEDYLKKLSIRRLQEGPEDKGVKGIVNAAKAGSSYCMSLYGSGLLRDDTSYKPLSESEDSRQEGMKYALKAAKKGNANIAKSLSYGYLLGDVGVSYFFEQDLGKYVCWSQIYNQSFPPVHKPILFENRIKDKIWTAKRNGKVFSFTQYDPQTLCQTIKE